MNTNQKAYLKLSAAMAIAGSSVVVGKLIVQSFPIFLANALSLAISSIILLTLLIRHEKGIPSIGKKQKFILLCQALTGVFLFRVFLFFGLKFTTAIDSGIITSSTPALIGLISFFFLKEKLGWKTSVGIGLAVLGILSINRPQTSLTVASGANSFLGNLLVFGAVVNEALYTIFTKTTSLKVTPLTASTSVSVLGLLMFLPLALYEAKGFDFSTVSLTDWLPIIYYGSAVSVIAYVLWFQGISKVPASVAGVFSGVMPVSTLLLSFVILKEPFVRSHLVGIVCVLLAIGLIAISSQKVKGEQDSRNSY
jgi:drug/metabolite transporter (DMT)-like permease